MKFNIGDIVRLKNIRSTKYTEEFGYKNGDVCVVLGNPYPEHKMSDVYFVRSFNGSINHYINEYFLEKVENE